MEILSVRDYNARQKVKYHDDCKNWDSRKGGFPQAAFYFFSTQFGQFRQKGFVGIKGNAHYFRLTKKELRAI